MTHYSKLKNIHKGETCIVIGNGPSLEDVPIDFLKSLPTFGCNRITLMTPEFVPNYYACLGFNQLDTWEKRMTLYPTIEHEACLAAFINRFWAHEFPYNKVFSILGGRAYGLEQTAVFSLEPLHITGLGYSMVFVLLQIAYYMGFTTVLMVGLDHKYPKGPKKHFYSDDDFPQFEVAPGPVYDHDPDKWQQGASLIFELANKVYDEDNRRIINISTASHCTAFQREALSDWYPEG